MPLSANGLCDAEIMTPRSARIERVSIATAGVGIGPSSTTSMPTLVKPATIADSIMYPLRRVSLPMTTRWPWSPRRKCAPAAMPTHSAVCAVIGSWLVRPRMPSVPKNLRVITRALARLADPAPEAGRDRMRPGRREEQHCPADQRHRAGVGAGRADQRRIADERADQQDRGDPHQHARDDPHHVAGGPQRRLAADDAIIMDHRPERHQSDDRVDDPEWPRPDPADERPAQ